MLLYLILLFSIDGSLELYIHTKEENISKGINIFKWSGLLVCNFYMVITREVVCSGLCSVALVMSNSLRLCELYPARFLWPWGSPSKNTRVGCHSLLQEIFLTQGSKPHLLCLQHWQEGSLPLALPGKPASTDNPPNTPEVYFSFA